MVSNRMQFSGSNHTYQIAFRVLTCMALYQTIFLLSVGSHLVLYLDLCCFSFIKMTYKNASCHHLYLSTLSAYYSTILEEKLIKDLDEVQKWLKSNKRTLKVKKTKYMIIGHHYRLRRQQLTRVTNHRYLGIEVEQALG